MVDESLTMADMNWRLVEDAKEAMSRSDWMLALSLFEQSRRICINEGWHEGVHYADDMILNIYPMVKRQIDDGNKFSYEKPDNVEGDLDTKSLPHQQPYFHAEEQKDEGDEDEGNQSGSQGDMKTNGSESNRGVFDESRSNRRLRRIINPDKED